MSAQGEVDVEAIVPTCEKGGKAESVRTAQMAGAARQDLPFDLLFLEGREKAH